MNRFEKAAIEVIQPFVKNKITHIIPDKSRNSVLSLDEAKTLAEAMDASARYGALNDTQVHLNGAKITGFQNRAVENKRNTGWAKMMAGVTDPFANMPDKSKNVPDAFFPNHDAVWLPSGNPGIMMHELGHAADMNEFPNTPFRRFVAGTYQNFSPTLWKEHAAWIKGKNRLIEGAAKTKVDPNLVVRTLEDAARVKPVGLGSYWGGGLGALAGVGLGLAAVLNRVAPPQAGPLGLLLGGAAGAFTGLQLGKMYGNSDRLGSEKAKQSYLDLYANQYAKEHGITLDKAKIELNNFIKAKKKPSKKGPIAKAAAFGDMMGKLAAGEAPTSPQPSARDIQIHNARMELQRKGQMVRDAAGGNGAYGTSRGTMKGGVMQPGATFTPQEGQQSQRPLPGAGGQINSPPVPRGMQPVPPASSPVIESKTPRRLF